MKITNFSTGELLSENAVNCNSFQKMKGLMFSRPRTLLFDMHKPTRAGLHMFFVFFPIDVLFLDENKKVIEMKQGFKPFKTYKPKQKARYIIELSAGVINSTRTKLGNRIVF